MNISNKKQVTLSHYEVLTLEAISTIAAALDTALDKTLAVLQLDHQHMAPVGEVRSRPLDGRSYDFT